jgi:hypothetical protein
MPATIPVALDYPLLFWIPGIVVAIAAVTTHLVIPESPIRTPGKINWTAAGLLSGWLVARCSKRNPKLSRTVVAVPGVCARCLPSVDRLPYYMPRFTSRPAG